MGVVLDCHSDGGCSCGDILFVQTPEGTCQALYAFSIFLQCTYKSVGLATANHNEVVEVHLVLHEVVSGVSASGEVQIQTGIELGVQLFHQATENGALSCLVDLLRHQK